MAKRFTLGFLLGTVAGIFGVYYLYFTKEGKRKRLKMKWWMIRAKSEIYEKLEELEEWSKDSYEEIVDSVLKKYKNIKNISAEELSDYSEYLKGKIDKAKKWFDEFREEV